MKTKSKQPLMLFLVLGLLSGCGASGDWPNLSDKMPDPADRNRVIERVEPAPFGRTPDKAPLSDTEAQALLTEITQAAQESEAAYRAALDRFKQYRPAASAPDDTTHLWLEAQLALTRFSQTISRMNTILDSALPADSPVRPETLQRKARFEAVVVTERNTLAGLNPDQGQ